MWNGCTAEELLDIFNTAKFDLMYINNSEFEITEISVGESVVNIRSLDTDNFPSLSSIDMDNVKDYEFSAGVLKVNTLRLGSVFKFV